MLSASLDGENWVIVSDSEISPYNNIVKIWINFFRRSN